MLRRTVGIDLAISAVQVAQIFDDGRPVGKAIRFRLTAADLRAFVARVVDGVPSGTPIEAVMEPTGMAWFPIATWLQRAGVKVIRVKGQRVKALRKYLSEHTKSDAADTHVLDTADVGAVERVLRSAARPQDPARCARAIRRRARRG